MTFLTFLTGAPRLRAFALAVAGATMEIPEMRNETPSIVMLSPPLALTHVKWEPD
jgi:hypothetical protein